MPESMFSMMREYRCDYSSYKPRDPNDRSDEDDITGKVIIITGCNTGLGKATAIDLAKRGGHIIMACRDLAKTQEALLDIKHICPNATLEIIELDLGDLESVRKFAEKVKEKYTHINILINNGGISKPSGKVEKTKDGFELHFGVNHLGHFLLTLLLLDLIKKGTPGRIIAVSSGAHLQAELDLNDLTLEKRKSFGKLVPYGNSKLANILFMRELSKRLQGTGVTTYSLCPGLVMTDISRNRQSWLQKVVTSISYKIAGLTPAQGAQTIIACATRKALAQESGNMYRFEKIWDRANNQLDEELGLKLWEVSEELVGFKNGGSSLKDSQGKDAVESSIFQ